MPVTAAAAWQICHNTGGGGRRGGALDPWTSLPMAGVGEVGEGEKEEEEEGSNPEQTKSERK